MNFNKEVNMEWRRAYTDKTKREAERIVVDWRRNDRSRGKPISRLKIRKDPNGRYEIWVHTT